MKWKINGKKWEEMEIPLIGLHYRNRRIGEFLKELDLVEGRNTGVPVIVHVMQDNGSPSPVFSSPETRDWLSVVLPIHEAFAEGEPKSVDEQRGEGTEKSAPKALRADFLKKISALGLTRPTEDNISRLFDRYGFDKSFSRLAVMDCLSLERSGATTFMMKIRELGLVEPAPEDGRGCYRFRS